MSKKPGTDAYEYYLKTGHIAGMQEGAWMRGNGVAPDNPMGFDAFLQRSRSIPKPPPPREEIHREPTDQERLNVQRMIHAATTPMREQSRRNQPPRPKPVDTSAPAMREMQRKHPDMHKGLTDVSRRMTGER